MGPCCYGQEKNFSTSIFRDEKLESWGMGQSETLSFVAYRRPCHISLTGGICKLGMNLRGASLPACLCHHFWDSFSFLLSLEKWGCAAGQNPNVSNFRSLGLSAVTMENLHNSSNALDGFWPTPDRRFSFGLFRLVFFDSTKFFSLRKGDRGNLNFWNAQRVAKKMAWTLMVSTEPQTDKGIIDTLSDRTAKEKEKH